MDTKEAIEWIRKITWTKYTDYSPEIFSQYKDLNVYREDRNKIIDLLKRGEEYKRVLEHIEVISKNDQVKRIARDTVLGG